MSNQEESVDLESSEDTFTSPILNKTTAGINYSSLNNNKANVYIKTKKNQKELKKNKNLIKHNNIFLEITNQILDLSSNYEEEHLWYKDDMSCTLQ